MPDQVIATLGEALQAMAPFAGGSVPATSDPEYNNWISWINEGQEDAATRGFWSRLLTKSTLAITADAPTATLPNNFHKRNGIYILEVDDIDWADPSNELQQKMTVHLNPTTAAWEVRFNGFTPTTSETAVLWYFYRPPILVEEDDVLFLDGKMLKYYGLMEYSRQSGELGSLDDYRQEYENRFSEGLNLDQLPAKNELVSWQSTYSNRHINTNERAFYSGLDRRNRK